MSNDAHTLTSQQQYEIREFVRARINGDPIDTWNTPVWILDMIAERDEARKWAREMYRRAIEAEKIVVDAIEVTAGVLSKDEQITELQRQLEEYENGRWHSFETVQAIVKERDELQRQLEESQEWDKFWHKQYDTMLNNYNLLANKSANELGIDSLVPVSIPEKIKDMRRRLEIATDVLENIQHGAIALPPEEAEKHYRKLATDALAKMDGDK
jgi:hypothetical protein